jgi:hypothetical protein
VNIADVLASLRNKISFVTSAFFPWHTKNGCLYLASSDVFAVVIATQRSGRERRSRESPPVWSGENRNRLPATLNIIRVQTGQRYRFDRSLSLGLSN